MRITSFDVPDGGHFNDPLADIVILKAQCFRDHGVHVVHPDGVGKLEDFLVREMFFERVEYAVRDPTAVIDKGVGVGEERAFDVAVTGRDLPVRNGRNLLFRQANRARRFAVLRIDELAGACPADTGLAEFAVFRVEFALGTIELEAGDGMVEGIGDEGEHRPPVARRTGVRARICDGIALAEQ